MKMSSAMTRLSGQFGRYLVVGGVATLFDIGLLVLLVSLFGMHPLIANIFGYALGTLVNYVLSVKWVFSTRNVRNRGAELAIFTVVGLGGLGINELTMYIGISLFLLDYRLVKILAVGVQVFWNFFGRKILLFRDPQSSSEEAEAPRES